MRIALAVLALAACAPGGDEPTDKASLANRADAITERADEEVNRAIEEMGPVEMYEPEDTGADGGGGEADAPER